MSTFTHDDDLNVEDYSYTEPDPAPTTPTPAEQSMSSGTNPLLANDNPHVSEIEQEVLDEYARLLRNVNQLSDKIDELAGSPASMTLDGVRLLERKTATVCTLLKASVYSIVLQQQIWNENEEQQQQQQQGDNESQFGDQDYTHATGGGYEDVTFQ
ncbi:hypothetical protein N7495_005271 [Penicillium taxi]|uniref:uncharacterized protein n=1 Tax=Penicillium taxi TaxID=168475 RepID=UPI002544D94F|nr:uncharacterized protein N7495_005271 [Penicillium taxi]KAJ5893580.1 hypothetical protein N7495_005271 [Penicillium taxi]